MQDKALQYFQSLETIRIFRQKYDTSARLSYSHLVQIALSPFTPEHQSTIPLINASLHYRRTYLQILKQLNAFYAPKVAAASDGTQVFERQTNDFQLSVNIAEDGPNNTVEVALKFFEKATSSKHVADLHCYSDDQVLPLQLLREESEFYRASISVQDAIFSALTDINAELYVR